MNFKKAICIFMTLVLLISVFAPSLSVMGTGSEAHSHTYGDWAFDIDAGSQSRTCTGCDHTEILYGTDTKVSQVEDPAVGGSYYLAANVAGTVYFFRHGTISDTQPYSLVTTNNVNHNWAFQVTLEAPVEGNTGFQMTYQNPTSGATTRIYCYDVLTTAGNSGIMDTGANTANYLNRHTFFVDEVGGIQVLRKIGNNNILVVKYNATKGEYRMLGVPESELGNDGVYPAMLVNVHSHSYGESYEYDQNSHWNTCDCGAKSQTEQHSYVLDETLGYEVCICGADLKPHECESEDGKWYIDGENHYQLCGECGAVINTADHTYGNWIFDSEKGHQSKICGVCEAAEFLYGTSDKVFAAANPAVGDSYYLAANVKGTIYYFVLEGSVTATNPYSLSVTTNLQNANLRRVTLETPVSGDTGFQITVIRQSDNKLLRIYCYDAGGNDGIMDTGTNATNEEAKHTFFIDEVGGVKVLRKVGNSNILVVKFNETTGTYRMLGVPESELGSEGVFPAMLVSVHTHSYGTEYAYDTSSHWHLCDCGGASETENHSFQLDETLGYEVCVCGADRKPHECESADGKWYADGETHHQLCGQCGDAINEEAHSYGDWNFDIEKGIQSHCCTLCGSVQTLYGTDNKVIPVDAPVVDQSYYLAANVAGTVYFFRHGQVTDTTPCSLWVTDDLNHNWVFPVTVEAPVDGQNGFQMQYINPSTSTAVRIYCYDSVGSDGIMDTGTNATNELAKHTFFIDEIGGVKVLRKVGNNHILVVKYNETTGTYRMLGVPESELANAGVYPAMLVNVHQHSYTDTTYHSDEMGHWYACQCGGKSNYSDHIVTKWEYTAVPSQTTPGSKTGVCTLCGATAVVEIPPIVAEGYYYLTGTVDGVKYYFRDKTGTESVEHTVPFSLLTTDQQKKAMQVNILWNEKANTYTLSYFSSRQLNIYMGDVNGSTVQKDGEIDLSSSATTSEDLITFYWDPDSQMFYQMEGGVKYVIAFRRMTLTDETQAVRMLAVPADELDENTAAMQLQVVHQHTYGETWKVDAINHYQECDCGTRKNEGAHSVAQWAVEKEATTSNPGRKSGVCNLCGEKIVQAIPMLNDNVKAPASGSKVYLIGTLNGSRYYFRHAPAGTSVTDTTPYSLATLTKGKTNILTIKVNDGKYNLTYGSNPYYIYINGNGVGVTSNSSNKDLVDFLWDEENKLLYQMENGVKCVLVFQLLRNNKTGGKEVRVTYMPMEQALVDPTVAIARFSTSAPPEEEKEESAALMMPEDATPLKTAEFQEPPAEVLPQDDAVSPRNLKNQIDKQEGENKLLLPVILSVVALVAVSLLLLLLQNTKFGIGFFRKWNLWTAAAFVIAAVVLVGGMLMPSATEKEEYSLADFTIVANAGNLDIAKELAVTLYEEYGVSLPVVQSKDYEGNMGIYLDTQGLNSYGGYKYSVYSEDNEYGPGIYINGSGPSLDTAISKWLKSVKDPYAFPFGLKESVSGYEWNTDDINMTGLGFTLKSSESKALSEGVELRELNYESFGYGKVTGYAVIVSSDADVELKVAAGHWDENTTPENPGEKHTVGQYGKMLTEEGYEVLAITNAGFYDLNTTMTYIPWGMQIVDGYVKKEPNEDNPNNTDNWFGQTADGKYVISNTAGYYETYETTLAQGVGGGRVLMRDGKPCFSTTGADYRTVVATTKGGDLVMLTISSANYAFITQILMDMNLDVDCVLNLDGGGSTTLHSLNDSGVLTQYICETPIEREVADAIAIVKKK